MPQQIPHFSHFYPRLWKKLGEKFHPNGTTFFLGNKGINDEDLEHLCAYLSIVNSKEKRVHLENNEITDFSCLEKINCVDLFLEGNKINSLNGIERFFIKNSSFRISVGRNDIQDFSPLIKILKDRCLVSRNQGSVFGDARDRVFSFDAFSDYDYNNYDLKIAFPIHAAVFYDYPDVLLSLIENCVDINKKYLTFDPFQIGDLEEINDRDFTFFNSSALEIALQLEHIECVHVLLFSGIDLCILKQFVEYPYKNLEIRQLLERSLERRNIFSLKFSIIQVIRQKNISIPENYPPLLLKYRHPEYNLNKRKHQ
jgi:hypothetical protein